MLQQGDILMALDGNTIDSAGRINIDGEDVDLNEIVERKYAGDTVTVRYLRDGTWNDIDIVLKPLEWSRMYAIQYEKNRVISFSQG
ncbi:MAG: PDZ domain-containing protein [Akkermansiaceae bacterium]|nr:PDZ domain-containing protein [Akkermansiaceae bacterium]